MALSEIISMEGTGNRFFIFDARITPIKLEAETVANLCQPGAVTEKGADQLIVMRNPAYGADVFMQIFNADGSEVSACGNATRCIGYLLAVELNKEEVTIETMAASKTPLIAKVDRESLIATVNMGTPKVQWDEIPLSKACDTIRIPMQVGELRDPVGVNMGNPHAVFFVDDVDAIDLETLGPEIESHPMFPERVNVGVASIINEEKIKLRVFERGVGETLACGTGACAAVVAAVRRELTEEQVTVHLRGGNLKIGWHVEGHIYMTGTVTAPEHIKLDESQVVNG